VLDPEKAEDIKSIEKCRLIKEEILKFGVNDLEIKKIIYFLSLELEDTFAMRQIVEFLKSTQSKKEIEKPKFSL
tara:strand:- start:1038 stop:1259 length:222 start_codon:yes stop_codon:yes gene_type:complete